jgi:serine/threonine protein kinase
VRETVAIEAGRRAGRSGDELTQLVHVSREGDYLTALVSAGIDPDIVVTTACELTHLAAAPRLLLKNPSVPREIDAQGVRSAGGVPIGSVQGRVWLAFCDPDAARAAMFSDDVVVCLALSRDLQAARDRFAAVHPDTGLDTVAMQVVTPEAIEAWRRKNAIDGPRTEVVAGPPSSMADDEVDEVFANNLDPGARRLLRRVQRGRLQRFRFERVLGRGSMATVYLARDRVDGATVAVKVLEPHLRDDAVAVERFRRELRMLQALRHPRIVEPLDGDIDGGVPWLTFRFLDGGNLVDLVAQTGPVPASATVPLIAAVLQALVHAHQHGVVHRDVKPHNVLLGTDGHVCLADFGLARAVGDAPITRTGAQFGTPAYMSPEHAQGSVVDERSDLFSCGLLLHFLLTGKNPLARTSVAETMTAMARGDVPALPATVRVPQRVRRLLEALTAPTPAARPASAAEALAALQPLLSKLQPVDEVVRRLLRNPLAFAGVGIVDDDDVEDRTEVVNDNPALPPRDTVALPVVERPHATTAGTAANEQTSRHDGDVQLDVPPLSAARAAGIGFALVGAVGLVVFALWWQLR